MTTYARTVSATARRIALSLLVLCGAAAHAAEADDPPGRVGRLGEMHGQVWLYTPDAGEWISAERNRPLTTGDRLSTDADARAELRVGSTTVRLDAGTELEILRIDDEQVSLQLHNGSVAVRLRHAEAAREFDLRTAEGRFVTHRAGRYRFDRADEASHVTVWSGQALYEGPGSALTVNAGQRAEFWLERDAAQYTITEPVRDAFAAWSGERDRADERSASSRYVSPEMTGAEELDRHGRWEEAPEVGTVWVPHRVPSGWVPYSAGHWAWISPWGWTWVDDAPWGFAPFHYGRWVVVHNRWCWAPGSYVRRPVYAPALVAWVDIGGGRHRHHGPHVGWFPLAPREVYVPAYRVSPRYVQRVNITHVTNITNVTTIVRNPNQVVRGTDYRNYRHANAVTVVPQTVMVNRQPVAPVAAQWRNDPSARQWTSQPGRPVAVAAPQVVTPTITPAVQQARRMRPRDDGPRGVVGVAGVIGQAAPTAVAPQAIPPAPGRARSPAMRATLEAEQPRAQTHDRPRRHEVVQEAPRAAAPVVVAPQAIPQQVVRPPQAVAPAVRHHGRGEPRAAIAPAPPVVADAPRPASPAPAARAQPMPAQAPAAVPVRAAPPAVRPGAVPAPAPQPAPQAEQRRENHHPNRGDDVRGRGEPRRGMDR